MNNEQIQSLVDLIRKKGEIKSVDIASILKIPIRRIYDVLPVLEVVGMITRLSRGVVSWVESVDSNVYDCNKLMISCVGTITEVKNMGVQLTIEQTGDRFAVERLD